jgi:hypothetical protein
MLVPACGKRRYTQPLVVSQSNHTSAGEVPLMSFDDAQDERDSKHGKYEVSLTRIYVRK